MSGVTGPHGSLFPRDNRQWDSVLVLWFSRSQRKAVVINVTFQSFFCISAKPSSWGLGRQFSQWGVVLTSGAMKHVSVLLRCLGCSQVTSSNTEGSSGSQWLLQSPRKHLAPLHISPLDISRTFHSPHLLAGRASHLFPPYCRIACLTNGTDTC